MGIMELFQVVLDRPDKVYRPGDVVHGAVSLTLAQPIQIQSVEVNLTGWATVKWYSGKGTSRKEHKEIEIYHNDTMVLKGAGDASSMLLGVGRYGFEFQFELRSTLPGSFEGQHGAVRYAVIAVIKRPMAEDHKVLVPINVPAVLNLNDEPHELREPVEIVGSEKVTGCCSCITSGSVDVKITLNRRCFLPGQTLHIRGVVTNNSSAAVGPAYAHIMKFVTYQTSRDESIETLQSVAVVASEELKPGEADNWDVPFVVPPLHASRMDYCGLITLVYIFEFRVKLPNEEDMQLFKQIMIGTMPYDGMADASVVVRSQPSRLTALAAS